MTTLHTYAAQVVWTGDLGAGTATYAGYSRDHVVQLPGRPPLPGSADPAFRGDPSRYSPEELLVAALSQCHMLWFLHLASASGIVVVGYTDNALGTMAVEPAGHGQFAEVVLRPAVTLGTTGLAGAGSTDAASAGSDMLTSLHADAHARCFIARSVSFPVRCEPARVTTTAVRR